MRHPVCVMLRRRVHLALAALVLASGVSPAAAAGPPLFVVLTETGQTRDGLPVLARHPDPSSVETVLSRGFSGRLLKLYRAAQALDASNGPIEPAYLLLSKNQGGFPRFGFWLGDEPKRGVAYVDLHWRSTPAGRFGAMDQIFPHELLHIILRRLAGEPPEGGANQVHALGVRTDPYVAFDEGFAEHAQVMAIDDEDAVPETARLRNDAALRRRAFEAYAAYARSMAAPFAPAARARMTFPLWFSGAEQTLRYHAVRENLYAFRPPVPDRLLDRAHLSAAHLIENSVPGSPDGVRWPARRLLSSEAAVSTFFVRWIAASSARSAADCCDEGAASAADARDAAYLELFRVLHRRKPHTVVDLVEAYAREFPEDAGVLDATVASVFGALPARAPELWVANDEFTTGTTLFDQFRGAPRVHTFDLNSATMVDLLGVRGMTRPLAASIVEQAPYAGMSDLRRVSGVPEAVVERLVEMQASMQRLRAEQVESSIRFRDVLLPYLRRALVWWAVVAAIAAIVQRRIARRGVARSVFNGLAAALVALAAAWTIDSGSGALALAAPAVLFGAPAMLWTWWRRRSLKIAAAMLAAWTIAGAAATAVTGVW